MTVKLIYYEGISMNMNGVELGDREKLRGKIVLRPLIHQIAVDFEDNTTTKYKVTIYEKENRNDTKITEMRNVDYVWLLDKEGKHLGIIRSGCTSMAISLEWVIRSDGAKEAYIFLNV